MPLTSHQAATEAEPEIAGNHQQETHPLDGRDALVVFKASTCNQSPTNKTLQLSGRQTTEAVEPSGTTKVRIHNHLFDTIRHSVTNTLNIFTTTEDEC